MTRRLLAGAAVDEVLSFVTEQTQEMTAADLTVGRVAGTLPLPQGAVELAMTFAAQAGIVLELAERRQDAERLSIFEDRDRIARDLHDQVIQRLYASGMKLQGTLPNSVVDDLDQTITDIRAAIFSLQARGPGLVA